MPLKTYLPDGDIDICAFPPPGAVSKWFYHFKTVLEKESINERAKFSIKNVVAVNADVSYFFFLNSLLCFLRSKFSKLLSEMFSWIYQPTKQVASVRCAFSKKLTGLLETITYLNVPSFWSKLGGPRLHLVLLHSYLYWYSMYESRILGSNHGLLSSYALETLVLFIINRFHESSKNPLHVFSFSFRKRFSLNLDNF